jgi:hypothetical protein
MRCCGANGVAFGKGCKAGKRIEGPDDLGDNMARRLGATYFAARGPEKTLRLSAVAIIGGIDP